ncbi:MAG: BON domain-containing protein, partial [Desulfotignum sp.]
MAQAKAIKILDKNLWFCVMTVVFFLLAFGISTAATDLVDENIESAVEKELSADQAVPDHLIDVGCVDNVVTLSGSVGNLLAKERAVSIAKTVKGVRSVVNRIAVELETEKSDSGIKTDVMEALLNDPATELYEIDTSVDNGV